MARTILLAILVALWALPAFAVDTTRYPQVLMDSTCTDTNDTPAAQSGGSTRPAVQTSGSADGYCDHDSRIREATLTADTVWGPFFRAPDMVGVRLYLDADDVTADAGTWNIEILHLRPHEAVYDVIGTKQFSAEGNITTSFGPTLLYNQVASTGTETAAAIPQRFYIRYTEGTATAWDGNMSWYQY